VLLLSQTSFFEILSTKFGKVSFSFLTFRLFQQEFVKEKDVKYPTIQKVGKKKMKEADHSEGEKRNVL
jgi:hypothetical protein